MVPFAQFKKREKHPWMSVNFSEACNFTKINTPPWALFTFLNCAHGTKSRKAPHILLPGQCKIALIQNKISLITNWDMLSPTTKEKYTLKVFPYCQYFQ